MKKEFSIPAFIKGIPSKTFSIALGVVTLIGFGFIVNRSNAAAAKIKVGVAETVITPPNPIGFPMEGYDRGKNTSTGVHDDLFARSIVIEAEDGTSVAMITIAVENIGLEIMDSIRSGVNKGTGIPFKNVLVSATHTHSGPTLMSVNDNYAHSGLPSGEINDYGRFFIKRSVESAVNAWKSRVPGKIGVGSANVYGLAMNDRRMEYGGLPPDPEAGIIKIEDANDKLMGIFFNYGCHPSTLDLHNLKFTEDWPYFSIKGIKEKVGKDVIVGYFQSAQGDAKVGYNAELSAVGAYMQGLRSFDFAEQKGLIMTDAVLKVLPSIQTSGDLQLKVAYDKFKVPRRTTFPYTQKEALLWKQRAQKTLAEKEKLVLSYPVDSQGVEKYQAAARDLVAKGEIGSIIGPRALDKYKVDYWLATQAVSQAKVIEEQPKNAGPYMMPMQAVRIGNSVFVTFPTEVFTEIGLTVKKRSPYENTFVFGLAGGHGGYIATAAEYIEGGYAVNGSPYAPQAEQAIIDASMDLINRVK